MRCMGPCPRKKSIHAEKFHTALHTRRKKSDKLRKRIKGLTNEMYEAGRAGDRKRVAELRGLREELDAQKKVGRDL